MAAPSADGVASRRLVAERKAWRKYDPLPPPPLFARSTLPPLTNCDSHICCS